MPVGSDEQHRLLQCLLQAHCPRQVERIESFERMRVKDPQGQRNEFGIDGYGVELSQILPDLFLESRVGPARQITIKSDGTDPFSRSAALAPARRNIRQHPCRHSSGQNVAKV